MSSLSFSSKVQSILTVKTWKSELRSRTLEALFLILTLGYLCVTEEDKCVLYLYLLNCEKRMLVFVSYLLQKETENRYLKHLEFPFL